MEKWTRGGFPLGLLCAWLVACGQGSESEGNPAQCGDGVLVASGAAAEDCDDGNDEAGDGCSPACQVEEGFVCRSEPSECVPGPEGADDDHFDGGIAGTGDGTAGTGGTDAGSARGGGGGSGNSGLGGGGSGNSGLGGGGSGNSGLGGGGSGNSGLGIAGSASSNGGEGGLVTDGGAPSIGGAGGQATGGAGGGAGAGGASAQGGAGGSPTAMPSDDPTNKLDLLFVIDNSISMAAKQEILMLALPDMISRLVQPWCVPAVGDPIPPVDGACAAGTTREFNPITDLHVGAITTSLGGTGAAQDCADVDAGKADNAHLLGSLPRVAQAEDFLSWSGDSSLLDDFSAQFQSIVGAAGETDCGWEATLESWYRFLIEPAPWTRVVRQNCSDADTNQLCVGPETGVDGVPLIDEELLAQRRRFLRPDSLLAVVMLSDENDCSFMASGQSWRLSETRTPVSPGSPDSVANNAYRGTAACETNPNDLCCHSCGTTTVPDGCPTEVAPSGSTVALGCSVPRYPSQDDLSRAGSAEPSLDAVNLRCFEQKRRFGVDYLYPVERYANAIRLTQLCPSSPTLDPVACDGELVDNPLYTDFSYEARLAEDPNAAPIVPRGSNEVFLVGILGVPWQDLAVDVAAEPLTYRTNRPSASSQQRIDWSLVLGADDQPPLDPLMLEQVEPRTGTHPVTGEALAPPASPELANRINGHEWNILDRDDIQYACIFPLAEPLACPDIGEGDGTTVGCDCTYYGAVQYQNPLCQQDSTFSNTQRYAGAYPARRQLSVLRDIGANGVVTSICPKETSNGASPDFGYRPAVRAMVEGMRGQLELR